MSTRKMSPPVSRTPAQSGMLGNILIVSALTPWRCAHRERDGRAEQLS